MTPTQLEVTEQQYNSGSSAICHCGTRNYFLLPLVSVSYQWNCSKCGEDNYHPLHQQARNKLNETSDQLQKLQRAMTLTIVLTNDDAVRNHPPYETPLPTIKELIEQYGNTKK